MNIEVTRDNVTILEQSEKPHENEYKITTCYFTFDEFTNYFQVKRAIFTILSTGEMYETDIIDNQCDIPSEVLKHEYETVKLGVYGYNIGDNEELLNRFSPSYAEIIVPTGSYKEGALSPEPITPSQYDIYSQKLQEGLQEVDDKLDEVVETVDSKIEEVDTKIDEIDEAIEKTEKLDVDAEKTGKITSITITKQDGTTKEVTLEDGMGLNYKWLGTSLGIKREDEQEYVYVDLQGPRGEPGAIKMTIVQELPSVGSEDTIYLVPLDTPESEKNRFAEYIYVNNSWELLGKIGIDIDLTNYYTKNETDTLLNGKQNTINAGNKLSSDLVDDTNSTNKFVTSQEKQNWNNKVDTSDLTDYVKNTDYATSSKGGVLKVSTDYGVGVMNGTLAGVGKTYQEYTSGNTGIIISKGTLENVFAGKGFITNQVSDLANYYNKTYIDALVGDINTALDTINNEVI